MAESQNNVTIRLRVPMGDMTGLRTGTQETAAWTRELRGLDRQFRSTFALITDYRTKQRQQGFLSDADQNRLAQLEQRAHAQRGREVIARTEGGTFGALPLSLGTTPLPTSMMRSQRLTDWQARAAATVPSPLDPGLVMTQRLSAWQARMMGQPPIPPGGLPVPPRLPGVLPGTILPGGAPARPFGIQPPPPLPGTPTRPPGGPPQQPGTPPPPRPPAGLPPTPPSTPPPPRQPGAPFPPTPPPGTPTPPGTPPTAPGTPQTPPAPRPQPPAPPQPTGPGWAPWQQNALYMGHVAGSMIGGGHMMWAGGQLGRQAGSSIGRTVGGMIGGATGLGGGTLGGGPLGAIAGTAIGTMTGLAAGLMIDRMIDRASEAMERYEQRVRSVAETSAQLVVPYGAVNASIDEMRDKYHYLAAESLQAWQSIAQHRGGALGPSAERALRFARAFGVAPSMAGEMQGRMERTVAPGTSLTDLAWAQYSQPFRPGVPEISPVQFTQQALGVAGAGGLAAPAMSGDYAGRMTAFVGGMGQRFPGQQAQFFQQWNQAASSPTDPMFEMMRHRAITRLRDRLPGGILTIGKGDDAEQVDLNTLRGRRKAMQLAGQSGQVLEEYARVGEEYGRGVPGLGEEFAHEVMAPGLPVFQVDRLLRERRTLGPEGLRTLERPLPAGKGREVEEDLMKALPQNFKDLIEVNARMEKALEPLSKYMFDIKNSLEGKVAGAIETGNVLRKNSADAIIAAIGTAMGAMSGAGTTLQSIYDTLSAWNQRLMQGMAPPSTAQPFVPPTYGPWAPPPDPSVNPQRSQ